MQGPFAEPLIDIESKYQNASNAYWVRSAPTTSRGKKVSPGTLRNINLPKRKAPNETDCPNNIMLLIPDKTTIPLFVVDYYIPPSLLLMFANSVNISQYEFSEQAWTNATSFQLQVGVNYL